MKFTQVEVFALIASIASAQTLNIPTRVGSITSLPSPSVITGDVDLGNKEFDRGHPCNSDEDTGDENAVFILEDGASLSNVIIGADSLEGVHCKGACTLRNVWFRDVCEDAISILGPGDALIIGGGAQEAKDKVVQHNNIGTVTIKDYTVVNAGKLYRSCGDCSNNEAKSPRHVIIDNVRAYGMTSDLVGINSNFGDTATISNSCGTTKKVCSEYKGINNHNGDSEKQTTNASCGGDQGKLSDLPTCDALPAQSSVAAPATTAKAMTTKTIPEASKASSVAAVTSEEAKSTKIYTYKVNSTKVVPSVKATSTGYPVSAKATPVKPTTLITRTKTSKAAAATTTKEPCAPKYGRCGGIGYSGATACPEGSKCVAMNPYYSQCV